MPDLDTSMHLDMLREYKRRSSLLHRLREAAKGVRSSEKIYGLEWGDPESVEPLRFVRDRYLLPYVNPLCEAVEIGPGGALD